ncbi:transmembrane protein 147-like [Hibiscus syriacus]|uniref:transmembrane protein 147-like n=1 Tax=Hibiscus syriacus TaxID=106335 RepID=UPI0019231BCB|nr:transmembrane protein 147-like [Hibiscus syriacus]
MTMFHFFNCAILTFGPHAVYYSATPLSEYDTFGTVKAALVYLGTALVKLVCLATFFKCLRTIVLTYTRDFYTEIYLHG